MRERRKGVHAFVKGDLIAGKNLLSEEPILVLPSDFSFPRIRYNPYEHEYFFEDETKLPIYEAEAVLLYDKKVFKVK